MRVSKKMKQQIQTIHKETYRVSLLLSSKKFCLHKTWPQFKYKVLKIEENCDIKFNTYDLKVVYSEGSLFRVFLHFFYCKRSCDNVNDYCNTCSFVRFANFQNISLFHDIFLPQKKLSKFGLRNSTLDLDIYLPCFFKSFFSNKRQCIRKRYFNHPTDIMLSFLSVLVRVNLNNYKEFFFKFKMNIQKERACVRLIFHYVRDIVNDFFLTNINCFFEIFNYFNKINRSICYSVNPAVENSYEPLFCKDTIYFGQLNVFKRFFANEDRPLNLDSDYSDSDD